jgi:magnesium-protoporphyrin IX monomethyl ester (oxidative) cyclase
VGGVRRLGLTLSAGLTFARLFCLPAHRNELPQSARLAPTW